MPRWVCWTHAGGPTGGFGGAPSGATKRSAGRVKMPNVMFRAACGRLHRGVRWSSLLWRHETLRCVTKFDGSGRMRRRHWGSTKR
eukprot:2552392-Pyramimonas_sp.AAC.1